MGHGDEIIGTAIARRLQQADARRVRFVHHTGTLRWSEVWNNNPRIAHPSETGIFQRFQYCSQNRPYVERKDDLRWYFRTYQCEPGELYLTDEERSQAIAGAVVIEPNVKRAASPNKRWMWERWQQLVKAMPLPWVQMGDGPWLEGVRQVQARTFRDACGVLSGAAAYVGVEGGLHHAAAALGIPAVVIFGGFVSPAQTGYATHRNLFTGGEPCGMRIPCGHCRAAMEQITVDMVAEELETVLR